MEGGKAYTTDALFDIIMKSKPYFGKKGGVTISGGEPLLQAKALIPLFKKLKAEGIHTALDTNGRILNHFAMELMDKYTDLVMLDIKHMTEEGYEHITGQKNNQTTFNFSEYREKSGKPMWLRYVLIPGLTDKPNLLESLGNYFKDYKTVEKLEIQPYHKLGVHKWEALGWEYQLKDARENTKEELHKVQTILEPYFKQISIN
jgi:pyruvate formate lyase activating enzyme